MTEDAEYIWKVTWEERAKDEVWISYKKYVKAFLNKREALMFACEKENQAGLVRNVKIIKWFGDNE